MPKPKSAHKAPSSWPKWKRPCEHCNKDSLRGDPFCEDHGGPWTTARDDRNWLAYLTWCLLPDTVRPHWPMPTTTATLYACQVALVSVLLEDDVRLTQTTKARMMAAILNAGAVKPLTTADAMALLTHLSPAEVVTTVRLLHDGGYIQ